MRHQIHTQRKTSKRSALIKKVVLTLLLVLSPPSTFAAGSFQQNVLLSPSNNILLAESEGRIMIYDGLKRETIDSAMDSQFNRIENMMFVRTSYRQDSGEFVVDEDDCD